MERRLRAAIGAIACTTAIGVVSAQRGAPPTPAQAPIARNYVVIGCVSREAAAARGRGGEATYTYSITDSRSSPPARYRIDADAEQLRWHVGHTLEISGTVTPASGGGAALPTLKVQSLTYISTTCVK
jgi:hypothetical protein